MILKCVYFRSLDERSKRREVSQNDPKPLYLDRGWKVVHKVATCNCGGGRIPLNLIGMQASTISTGPLARRLFVAVGPVRASDMQLLLARRATKVFLVFFS